MERKQWHTIWMNLAYNISARSTCNTPCRSVGCVVVSENNERVLALGYNGGAKGDDNSCSYDAEFDDCMIIGTSRCSCVHAEMNALTKLDSTTPDRKVMYITLSPCTLCAKLVVNAGISKVVYDELYSEDVIIYLESLGVECVEYSSHWRG